MELRTISALGVQQAAGRRKAYWDYLGHHQARPWMDTFPEHMNKELEWDYHDAETSKDVHRNRLSWFPSSDLDQVTMGSVM